MGSYDSRALFLSNFTNLRQANKLDNGPAACVPIIPQEQASQISPIHLPQTLYTRWQGGEGARRTINNQITMTTTAADMLAAMATTTTATAMMATATTATRRQKKRRRRTATAMTSTMVMGGGGDDHDNDNSNGSGGGLIQQSTKIGSGRAATAMATETAMVTAMADYIQRRRR